MKKSILFLAVALMTITLFMSSSFKPEERVVPCVGTYTLECDLVTDMKDQYENNQLKYINGYLEHVYPTEGDAKAVWLPLDVLKDFICQIDERTDSIPDRDLGVRFYYAAYPEAVDWEKYPDLKNSPPLGVSKSYAERHTLLLVPTQTTPAGIHDLFLQPGGQPSGGGPVFGLIPGIGEKRRPSKNHGSLFPPDPLIKRECE